MTRREMAKTECFLRTPREMIFGVYGVGANGQKQPIHFAPEINSRLKEKRWREMNRATPMHAFARVEPKGVPPPRKHAVAIRAARIPRD